MKGADEILSYKKLQQLNGEGIEYGNKFKILIVDDNVYDSELMLRELNRKPKIKIIGKTVTNKNDYEEALVNFLPDVVYCDLNIAPGFDGVDAIRILKKDSPEVPFVLVTGALNEEVVSICVNEGINDYVLKTNMSRLPLSLINAIKIRRIELQKKETYEKLVWSEARVKNFATHLNKVLEEERRRIAREMHDELGQQLAGMKMMLNLIKRSVGINEKAAENINIVLHDTDKAIQCIRKIATDLRPGILDSLGLAASIEWLVREFENKTGINCRFRQNVKQAKFGGELSICFFRICQESLTNIIKHSGANEVVIDLNQENGKLMMSITDNGKGISGDKLENPFSMGLIGMQERARIVNGNLRINSKKGSGTNINLAVNLN